MSHSTTDEHTHSIYIISNSITGKVYVGRCNNIKRRKGQHFTMLRLGVHHSSKLQVAYDKYGRSAFVFEVIEQGLSYEQSLGYESYWINHHDSLNSGYNMVKGSSRGVKPRFRVKQRTFITSTLPGVIVGYDLIANEETLKALRNKFRSRKMN